jgi:hypothetical protein
MEVNEQYGDLDSFDDRLLVAGATIGVRIDPNTKRRSFLHDLRAPEAKTLLVDVKTYINIQGEIIIVVGKSRRQMITR